MTAIAGPVLVIDDDADIRETLKVVLESYGYCLTQAGTGAAALEWLRTNTAAMIVLALLASVERQLATKRE